jgi:hypothetical protein
MVVEHIFSIFYHPIFQKGWSCWKNKIERFFSEKLCNTVFQVEKDYCRVCGYWKSVLLSEDALKSFKTFPMVLEFSNILDFSFEGKLKRKKMDCHITYLGYFDKIRIAVIG